MADVIPFTDPFADEMALALSLPEVEPPEFAPHVLVLKFDDDGDPDYTIEHLDSCERNVLSGSEWFTCGVQFEADHEGIECFFAADPEDMHSHAVLLKHPGRYWIESWSKKVGHYDGWPEYDGGLKLVYPEEAHRG